MYLKYLCIKSIRTIITKNCSSSFPYTRSSKIYCSSIDECTVFENLSRRLVTAGVIKNGLGLNWIVDIMGLAKILLNFDFYTTILKLSSLEMRQHFEPLEQNCREEQKKLLLKSAKVQTLLSQKNCFLISVYNIRDREKIKEFLLRTEIFFVFFPSAISFN